MTKALQTTRHSLHAAPRALAVHLLGPTDYDSCLQLQQRLVYEQGAPDGQRPTLLLCEHPPLVTVGRHGSWADLDCDPRDLLSRQISVRWVNRGGGAWLHLPGQLAVYPVLPLDALGLGLSDYLERLGRAALGALAEFDVRAQLQPRTKEIRARHGRLGALGVAVKRWVSYHGFYLNVSPELEPFRLVGASRNGDRASSMTTERHRPVKPAAVREAVVRHVAGALGLGHYHVSTGHPLLVRRRRRYVPVESLG